MANEASYERGACLRLAAACFLPRVWAAPCLAARAAADVCNPEHAYTVHPTNYWQFFLLDDFYTGIKSVNSLPKLVFAKLKKTTRSDESNDGHNTTGREISNMHTVICLAAKMLK